MKYRKIKSGEIIESTDDYISFHDLTQSHYIPVCDHSVGQTMLECNAKYYRRPISPKNSMKHK